MATETEIQANILKLQSKINLLQEKACKMFGNILPKPLSMPKPNTTTLTKDQQERIEKNRLKAIQIRKKRSFESSTSSSSSSSSITTTNTNKRAKPNYHAGLSELEITPFQRNINETDKMISTLCEGFDELMEGGITSTDIFEVNGPSSSGKSQLVHQILTSVVVNSTTDKAIMIDTSNSFRPSRILQIAKGNSFIGGKKIKIGSDTSLLDRIQFARCANYDHLLGLLTSVLEREDTCSLPRLVVVDSISRLFRCVDHKKRQESRQSLNLVMTTLKKLTQRNVAVVITNEVTADFSANEGSTKAFKPAGGQQITKFLVSE
jgi:RecA/RadA recombinase